MYSAPVACTNADSIEVFDRDVNSIWRHTASILPVPEFEYNDWGEITAVEGDHVAVLAYIRGRGRFVVYKKDPGSGPLTVSLAPAITSSALPVSVEASASLDDWHATPLSNDDLTPLPDGRGSFPPIVPPRYRYPPLLAPPFRRGITTLTPTPTTLRSRSPR